MEKFGEMGEERRRRDWFKDTSVEFVTIVLVEY